MGCSGSRSGSHIIAPLIVNDSIPSSKSSPSSRLIRHRKGWSEADNPQAPLQVSPVLRIDPLPDVELVPASTSQPHLLSPNPTSGLHMLGAELGSSSIRHSRDGSGETNSIHPGLVYTTTTSKTTMNVSVEIDSSDIPQPTNIRAITKSEAFDVSNNVPESRESKRIANQKHLHHRSTEIDLGDEFNGVPKVESEALHASDSGSSEAESIDDQDLNVSVEVRLLRIMEKVRQQRVEEKKEQMILRNIHRKGKLWTSELTPVLFERVVPPEAIHSVWNPHLATFYERAGSVNFGWGRIPSSHFGSLKLQPLSSCGTGTSSVAGKTRAPSEGPKFRNDSLRRIVESHHVVDDQGKLSREDSYLLILREHPQLFKPESRRLHRLHVSVSSWVDELADVNFNSPPNFFFREDLDVVSSSGLHLDPELEQGFSPMLNKKLYSSGDFKGISALSSGNRSASLSEKEMTSDLSLRTDIPNLIHDSESTFKDSNTDRTGGTARGSVVLQ